MNDAYLEMVKQSLKAAGMTDAQIEENLKAQKAAMENAMGMMGQNMGALMQMGAKMAQAAQKMNLGAGTDSYFEFAEPSTLDKSDQWAVACGADLIHLRADVINDLTSGNDAQMCKEILSEQWGINNKKEFMEMAESLLEGRHSSIYNKLAAGEKVADYEDEGENLKQALEVFAKDGLIKAGTAPDMLAWDLCRLINICRFAFDAKILKREESLKLIRQAAVEIKKHYKSWQEISLAYQFGRAVWGSIDDSYEEMKEGSHQLLTEKDSPWVTLDYNMILEFKA